MARDASAEDQPRELRLEGLGLTIAGGILVALLFGAFQLGRVIERSSTPGRAAAPSSDPLANLEPEVADSGEKLTFFDTLSAPGQQAEPKREAQGAAPAASPPPTSGGGPWFVQVFVGRDRAAAEEVVKTLRGKGYPVRVEGVREGASGSLYKVRVGGFATREAAEASVGRLHGDGQASTWVVKTGA